MTQETNLIVTQLEIKRSLLTKQLELRDQSWNSIDKNIKKSNSTKHFWKLYKSSSKFIYLMIIMKFCYVLAQYYSLLAK